MRGEQSMKYNLRKIMLRACTRMAEAGIDPKVLQAIMGHSNISVTMDIYNHTDAVRLKNEMQKADGIIKYG